MSTKTSFKRIALSLVVALGFSIMASGPSQGAILASTETLTIDAATDTAFLGETATAVLTHKWGTTQASANLESVTIKAVCSAPTGATCPVATYFLTPTSETANISVDVSRTDIKYSGYWTETASSTSGDLARSDVSVKAMNFTKAGTYVYTFYTQWSSTTIAAAPTVSTVSLTWTITVSGRDTATSSIGLYSVDASMAAAQTTLDRYRLSFLSARESSVTTVRGTATSPTAVVIAAVTARNAAGETVVAGPLDLANSSNANSTGTALQDTFTVTISGPGLVSVPGNSTTRGKSATLTTFNKGTYGYYSGSGETLVVWSDGTAGTGTVSISTSGGTVLKSFTVIFTGAPASAADLRVTDTVTAISATSKSGYLKFRVFDSGSNELTTGNTVYVYATDTKVVSAGALSTSSSQYTQSAAGVRPNTSAHACTYSSTDGAFSCDMTVSDTGTATLYVRDSWTVTGSTWVSSGVEITGIGNLAKTWSVAFDKSTYNVGDQAVITITGTDAAGRAVSNSATMGTITTSYAFGNSGNTTKGTAGSISATSGTFTGYIASGTGVETGIETRVVIMPVTAGTMTYTIQYVPVLSSTTTSASASVTVVDPLEAVIKTQVDAAKAEAAAATAAADAATDAALQAIDAANAATDAANLAAEAADAATVAAEEAKDAADAATAAVEALATQVATLMAALQAQVRSLANTVAKIAKKVKA